MQTARGQLRTPTIAAMRQKHQRAMAARQVPIRAMPDALVAEVNHGRWLALCPCGTGVALDPDWPEARCFGCGAVFAAVIWPPDRPAIETLLARRRWPQNQNWYPGESLDALRADNAAHPEGVI